MAKNSGLAINNEVMDEIDLDDLFIIIKSRDFIFVQKRWTMCKIL